MNEVTVTIITVVQLLSAILLICFVLFQSGKHAGLGVVDGAADTFLAKNQAKTVDAKLAKFTKWVACLFVLLTLTLSLI